jgi:outer membrane protein OmpA-like peptidoglycan-associated protein
MKLRNMMLATAIVAVPMAAKAQPVTGVYVGAGFGFNYVSQWDRKAVTGPRGIQTNLTEFGGAGGPVGLVSVGYGFGNGLRLELEGNWRQSDRSVRLGYTGGGLKTYGVMGNALFDFNVGSPWIMPYIGAGIGYETDRLDNIQGTTNGVTTGYGGTKGGLAAQGILGAAIPVTSVPGLAITAEYRFMAGLDNPTYQGRAVVAGGPGRGFSVQYGTQYNNAGLIGFRYNFGQAPAQVVQTTQAAAPAPAPARTYLVFFDWDKSDLSARARQIIAEAATASTHVAVTRIEVSGHADRTGTAQYNQALSVRRADAVAAELVRLGVNRSAITVQGFGDTRPLVPTGPNTREPQNRRVEIVLR